MFEFYFILKINTCYVYLPSILNPESNVETEIFFLAKFKYTRFLKILTILLFTITIII